MQSHKIRWNALSPTRWLGPGIAFGTRRSTFVVRFFFRDHKVATFPIHILDSCLPDSKIQVTDSAFNAIRQNQVERVVPNALARGQASPSGQGDPPSSFDFFSGTARLLLSRSTSAFPGFLASRFNNSRHRFERKIWIEMIGREPVAIEQG